MTGDSSNPIHRAGFYIEKMKYGPGPKTVERVSKDELHNQIDLLLREGKIDLTVDQVVEAADYYGKSFSEQFGIPLVLTRSIFYDGLLHGLATAAKLGADPDPNW